MLFTLLHANIYGQMKSLPEWQNGISLNEGKSFALIVGIDEYNCGWLPDLIHPVREAKELGALLESQGYIVRILQDSSATRENLLSNIDALTVNREPNDRILFYYGGHGESLGNVGARMGGNYYSQYFGREIAYSNSIPDSDYLTFTLYQSDCYQFKDVVGAHEIAQKMNASGAHQRIMIVDACFSGNVSLPAGYEPSIYGINLTDDGFCMITGMKSRNLDGAQGRCMFKGLNGLADTTLAGNNNGKISLYELAVFMNDQLPRKNDSSSHRIRFLSAGAGEFELIQYKK